MKSCIIKLTELSSSEREQWLTNSNTSSSPKINRTTKSVDSVSSTESHYNMRSRPASFHRRATRKSQPKINYNEQGVKDSRQDSDFEPVLKLQPPLDNKRNPTSSRIAIQREIELNKASKCSASKAFPDVMNAPKKNSSDTGVPQVPQTLITLTLTMTINTTTITSRHNRQLTTNRGTRRNTKSVTRQNNGEYASTRHNQ